VSADKKRELIELVRRSPQPKRATITELGLSRLPFYRWQRRYPEQGEAGLVDRKPEPGAVWKRLRARGGGLGWGTSFEVVPEYRCRAYRTSHLRRLHVCESVIKR
jgi:hypothetical protein